MLGTDHIAARLSGMAFSTSDKIGTARRTSALSTVLWALGTVGAVGLGGGYVFHDDQVMRRLIFTPFFALVLLYICMYVFFARRNPDYLLTEDYRLKQAAMQLLSQAGPITDPERLIAVVNPEAAGTTGQQDG